MSRAIRKPGTGAAIRFEQYEALRNLKWGQGFRPCRQRFGPAASSANSRHILNASDLRAMRHKTKPGYPSRRARFHKSRRASQSAPALGYRKDISQSPRPSGSAQSSDPESERSVPRVDPDCAASGPRCRNKFPRRRRCQNNRCGCAPESALNQRFAHRNVFSFHSQATPRAGSSLPAHNQIDLHPWRATLHYRSSRIVSACLQERWS